MPRSPTPSLFGLFYNKKVFSQYGGGPGWPTQILGGHMDKVQDRQTTFDAPGSPFIDGVEA